MDDPHLERPGVPPLRRWVTWAAVVGTALWAGYFFVFLVYQSLMGSADAQSWFVRMIQDHPAATIGVAMSAITAFCLVSVLEVSRGPVEFEGLGFSFKGASGPIVLWVLCFLVMIFAVWLLWDRPGPERGAQRAAGLSSCCAAPRGVDVTAERSAWRWPSP